MKKISFYTFGCRLNQSETALLRNSFERQGYRVVGWHEPSDIVVINTCTVTKESDADCRRLVHKVNRLNPAAQIALVGCQAQIQKGKLSSLPNVRWIVGNERKMDLVSVFDEYPQPECAQLVTPSIQSGPFRLSMTSGDREHTRANIKIQDGCDFFCSFCEIPYARGRSRSRVFEDIITQAKTLAAWGHKELILTGINIGTYSYQGKTLMDIVRAMKALEGLQRVRISSVELTTVTEDVFTEMGHGGKLCRHLHIPLQSGDDEILRAMERKYTAEDFGGFIRRAHACVPQICTGTDVMVGFPLETDAHFEKTLEVLGRLPVAYLHVFSYSARHTAKSRLLKPLPAPVVSQRSHILRELSMAKRRLFHESLLGSVQTVLFEKLKSDGWQYGLTDNYVRVKVKDARMLANQVLPVRLLGIDGQVVRGETVA